MNGPNGSMGAGAAAVTGQSRPGSRSRLAREYLTLREPSAASRAGKLPRKRPPNLRYGGLNQEESVGSLDLADSKPAGGASLAYRPAPHPYGLDCRNQL